MIVFAIRAGLMLSTCLLLTCLTTAAQKVSEVSRSADLTTSLHELRDKRSALLLVFRSGIVTVQNDDETILDLILKSDPEPKGRYQSVYGIMAKKLNKYISKYKSLTAAHTITEADYIIFFNLLEYRRILNTVYPYGELFVILKGSPETQKPPHIA